MPEQYVVEEWSEAAQMWVIPPDIRRCVGSFKFASRLMYELQKLSHARFRMRRLAGAAYEPVS